MYIAIEGVKGSGKSTLLSLLQPWLSTRGVNFCLLAPTRPLPSGSWWEQANAEPRFSADDSFREALYAARSNHHAANADFRSSLVLGDRSLLTSLVTRWERVDRLGLAGHLGEVRKLEHRIPLPDHVIYLDLSEPDLLERLAKRTDRRYGKNDEHPDRLKAARQAYAALSSEQSLAELSAIRWHVLDATAAPATVVTNAGYLIQGLLSGVQRRVA